MAIRRKKKYIKYKHQRVVLSDILPYEVPITFSNRYFYKFLLEYKIIYSDGKVKFASSSETFKAILRILLGLDSGYPIEADTVTLVNEKKDKRESLPFTYRIAHKEADFRELNIVHPKNQIDIIGFYRNYQELIIHYCSLSPFSIRKPHRVAKYRYFKDRLHVNRLVEPDDEIVEENDKEYENLKTYFVYKKYANIHKFYESFQYHKCEKKYNHLLKFDISKCFDSIYTHSLPWATIGKEPIKKWLTAYKKNTFGHEFDSLMQKLNYNETNGIVIGPEFSRIFAEIILQRIDLEVKEELVNLNYVHKRDYEIFRYVDDYFVFFNSSAVKDSVIKAFRVKLRDYKMAINESKFHEYKKPIITEITVAKQKIARLLNSIKYDLNELQILDEMDEVIEIKKTGSIDVYSSRLIVKFKTILFESNVDYKDILNYTLHIFERKLLRIIKDHYKIDHEFRREKVFIAVMLELVEFLFFIYSVSPKVNSTIKLCRVLRVITETFNHKSRSTSDLKHLVYKKIFDNIHFILQKNRTIKYSQVETMYLLITLGELGKEYWLSEDNLADYLCVELDSAGKYSSNVDLNYFSIVVSLFYMKRKKRFTKLREYIEAVILNKFTSVDYNSRLKRTELILLFFDVLSCPHLSVEFKRKTLSQFECTDETMQNNIINFRKTWFTNWSGFSFGKELDAKYSQEVY